MIRVRRINVKEIDTVVAIHCDAFDGFFLTELGVKFLVMYYTTFLKHRNGVILGIYQDDCICGFVAATKSSVGFNSSIIKDNFALYFTATIRLLFTKPAALMRLMCNLSKSKGQIYDNGNYAELFSIGILKKYQGQNLGKTLLKELECHLNNECYCSQLSLTTDYYNNDATIAFYFSMGYDILYDFTTYPHRRMYRLIKKL